MSSRGSRQLITGLLANSKPNTKVEDRLRLRAMCRYLFLGQPTYKDAFFVDEKNDQEPASRNYLRGRLAFQYQIDHWKDKRDHFDRRKDQTSRDRLYRQFLAFDIFYPESDTLIITEGDTDKTYIRAAALALKPFDTRFVKSSPSGDAIFVPRFFKRSKSVQNILGFHPGTPGIASSLYDFHQFRKAYPQVSQRYPVVIVVDNDAGLKDIESPLKKYFGVKISAPPPNGALFYKLHKGIYLVKIPLPQGASEARIEDLLTPATLATVISGKTFCAKDIDETRNYGKSVLAAHVWKHRSKTDLLGFDPLLSAIEAVFNDFGI